MGIQKCDRIIIPTNERNEFIIRWYLDNRKWLDQLEFQMPLMKGVLEFREEYKLYFETLKNGHVLLKMYPDLDDLWAFTIMYDPVTQETYNLTLPVTTYKREQALRNLIMQGHTHMKAVLKYHSIMCFIIERLLSGQRHRRSLQILRRRKHRTRSHGRRKDP